MSVLSVSIAEGRADLSTLIKKAKSGVNVVFTKHGKPEAVLTAYRPASKPWRVDAPDDLARYGDLDSPVMEEFQ